MRRKRAGAGRAVSPKRNRHVTKPAVIRLVWTRAAGHCELCGIDLTRDFRVGQPTTWGEAAHILPASPQEPRAQPDHSDAQARHRTNDADNLMLLCPGCHEKIDKDDRGYPLLDLSGLHKMQLERIALAACSPAHMRAVPVLVLSQHFATINHLRDHDFLHVMSREGLHAVCAPVRVQLPALPASGVRNEAYWRAIADQIHHTLVTRLNRSGPESADLLAVAGFADIGALIMLGQVIGDRMPRRLFSPNRASGLHWPDPAAHAPEFLFSAAPVGDGPLALVLSLSAKVPHIDVESALRGARIAEFFIAEPNVSMVHNRDVIDAFRAALQKRLSDLEVQERGIIHLFMAIPAALAIEFGALLTLQHRHGYRIYDRSETGAFEATLTLDHTQKGTRP